MKKVLILGLILVAIAGSAYVWSTRGSESSQTTTPAPAPAAPTDEETDQEATDTKSPATQVNNVSIEDFSFSPATITIKKGTTVTWTNKDSVGHTATPDTPVGEFGSELLAKDQTYSYTFDTAGTFAYHCRPHPNMKATVIVAP